MDTRGYIDISALDLRKLVAAAFDYSSPQGLGYLHHVAGPTTDEEIDRGLREKGAYYDYVRGRSMKLSISRDGDKLYWHHGWYDHGDASQLAVLVKAGMSQEDAEAVMDRAVIELAEKNADFEHHTA